MSPFTRDIAANPAQAAGQGPTAPAASPRSSPHSHTREIPSPARCRPSPPWPGLPGAAGMVPRAREMGTRCCHLPRRGVQEAPSEPFWAVHLGHRKEDLSFQGVRGRGDELQQKTPGWKLQVQTGLRSQMIPNVAKEASAVKMSKDEPLQILSAPFEGRFHTHTEIPGQ